MSFFNTFNTLLPFCQRAVVASNGITSASYGIISANAIQIANIVGIFSGIVIIRTNLVNNTVVNIPLNTFSSGSSYIDYTVTINTTYLYQIQPILNGQYGGIFTVPGTASTLVNSVNYSNLVDSSNLTIYYSFEPFTKPNGLVTTAYTGIIDSSNMLMYYNFDYI